MRNAIHIYLLYYHIESKEKYDSQNHSASCQMP